MLFPTIKTILRSKFPYPVKGKFRSNVVQNSPSVKGVATEGRRGSVVRRSPMCFRKKILPCVADTTPSFFC